MTSTLPDATATAPAATSTPSVTSAVDNTTPALRRAWYAVALAADVGTDPVPVTVLGEHWIVMRLDGQIAAFADQCPHRLAPLSIGTGDGARLRCGYHGWEFDGTGACTRIPALGDAAAIPPKAQLRQPAGVQERYGLVWIAPDEPLADLPDFWEWDDAAFDTCWNSPRPTTAGAGQLCDNFLDAAHIPVVHTGTFGVPGSDELPAEPVDHADDGWTASTTYRVTYKNHDDPLVATGEHPLEQPQDLYKEVRPATTAFIRLGFPLTGKVIAILFSCLPVDAERTVVFKMMARNDFDGDAERLAASIVFEDQVLDEDLAVLEAYRSKALPTNTTVEVSTRVDRLSVAYRRLLHRMVTDTAPD
ncbi:MAG: aromatic ring-hydroxylating dioxygenase subunit alpha [Actinomycetota bacterium]